MLLGWKAERWFRRLKMRGWNECNQFTRPFGWNNTKYLSSGDSCRPFALTALLQICHKRLSPATVKNTNDRGTANRLTNYFAVYLTFGWRTGTPEKSVRIQCCLWVESADYLYPAIWLSRIMIYHVTITHTFPELYSLNSETFFALNKCDEHDMKRIHSSAQELAGNMT